ncbi:hypothetical protein D6817_03720 [Candidatus Pacearchaeota archaeon]|nr:MAG: hypothetical protein D6817_03720 [Candidatus Pacearchaeota archaeon]
MAGFPRGTSPASATEKRAQANSCARRRAQIKNKAKISQLRCIYKRIYTNPRGSEAFQKNARPTLAPRERATKKS